MTNFKILKINFCVECHRERVYKVWVKRIITVQAVQRFGNRSFRKKNISAENDPKTTLNTWKSYFGNISAPNDLMTLNTTKAKVLHIHFTSIRVPTCFCFCFMMSLIKTICNSSFFYNPQYVHTFVEVYFTYMQVHTVYKYTP